MSPLLLSLTPAWAVFLLTCCLLLIAWELNRPGSILPGSFGVLGSLFALAALTRFSVRPLPLCLLAVCVGLLGSGLLWHLPWYLLFAATVGLVIALHGVVPGSQAVPWSEAVLCGTVLGGTGSVLARIALRARRAKQVN